MADDGDGNNGDHKNTCVICLERLNDGVIGAATPCGHCFHENCFDGWRHSQNRTTPQSPWFEQLRPVKCPMCNKESTGFCRLYLDLDALGSGGGDDDDDDSESDDSSIGSEDNKTDNEEEDDDQGDPVGGSEADPGPDQMQEERGQSTNHQDSMAVGAVPGSVEVIEINDDDDDDDEAESVPPVKNLTATTRGSSCDKDKKKNYRARAKLLRRRIKMLERQRNEQYQELVEVQDKFGKARTALTEMEVAMSGLRSKGELYERERESTTLQLVRLSREKDDLSSRLEQAAAEKDKVERRLEEARKDHERELKRAQASSMSEVQRMLNDHPHLIRENRELKQLNEKYKLRLRELQSQKVPAASSSREGVNPAVARKVSSSSTERPGVRHAPVPSSAIEAARQLSVLDARYQADQKRRERDEGHAQSKSEMLAKVSAHAARFTSRTAVERKANPLASLSLLDARNHAVEEGDRNGGNPKRLPSQLLPITMPIQKRSKSGGANPRATSFLSTRR